MYHPTWILTYCCESLATYQPIHGYGEKHASYSDDLRILLVCAIVSMSLQRELKNGNVTWVLYFSYSLCDRCNRFAFGLGSAIRWLLQLGSKSVNVSAVLYFSYTLCDRCNRFAFGLGSAIRISRISGNSEVCKPRNQRVPKQKYKKA